jgi:outer membrane protein
MKKALLILTGAVLFMTAGAVTAAELRIAVVDMEKVMEESPAAAKVEQAVKEAEEEFVSERESMLKTRDKLRREFEDIREEASNEALSEKGKREKIEEAEEKLAELKEYQEELQQTGMARRRRLREQKVRAHRKVIGGLRERIGAYASEQGFDLVLNSSGLGVDGIEMVVYSKADMDITDEVIENVIESESESESGDESEKPEEDTE